jgi:hypothetical protein
MIEFAAGSQIFLAVLVLMLVGIIVGLYTRKGSGIDQHPYRHVYGGAPGAALPSEVSGSDRTSVTEHPTNRGEHPTKHRR